MFKAAHLNLSRYLILGWSNNFEISKIIITVYYAMPKIFLLNSVTKHTSMSLTHDWIKDSSCRSTTSVYRSVGRAFLILSRHFW